MQHIGARPRLGAQALILAFAAFMLVAIGCTGAHASPTEQATSISASPALPGSGADTFAADTFAADAFADAVGQAPPSIDTSGSWDRTDLDKGTPAPTLR